MRLTVRRWLGFGLLLLLPLALPAAGFQEGKEYAAVSPPQPTNDPSKIEVVELFWYGCPHCYHLEPQLREWLAGQPDDVDFIRMPAILGANWELLGRARYTAELLGVDDKLHQALFDYLHRERKRLRSVDEVRNFFVAHGVSAEDFDNTWNSFGVVAKVNRAKQMSRRYGITGVPAFVIDGKYRTSATQAGSEDKMFEVINMLIDKERKARGQ